MTETVNATSIRASLGGVRMRKNILHLSARELNDFRKAIEGLYKISEEGGNNDERGYQWIAGVHGYPTPVYCQHGNANFPTWHRAYLYEYEQRLQDIVPTVMLPYWDWSAEDAHLIGIPDAFTDETYTDLDTGETKPNPLLSAYSQVTNTQTTRNPHPNDELSNLRNQYELALRQQTYDRFHPALEQPHNGLHVWVGGDMGRVPLSAYDPIFWCHHCNVDRQWFEWQRHNGNSTVPTSVLNWVCAPFPYKGQDTMDTAYFGYTYADSEFTPETDGDEAAITPSANANTGYLRIPVSDRSFKHAFLEIQGLQKAEETLIINIAIGETDTVADFTGAARFVILGHGQCPGAPGHCSVPEPNPYDKRAKHHLTPFDSYQDITNPLKDYLDNGQDMIVLTITVTDQDNRPVPVADLPYKGISIVTHR
ncbi:tyrosinase family protein [Kordiimonas sp. SCSIO 12603]|uniref:tyrosinase family protein n=1 Tax=Kordiimonas sp. SCSIO 12603 TaxID=2829596 RepID=UPI0021026D98|nr:tyrosinase family protein [Kordiimonas sp. SCSIO 12603]UTW59587.1 tyrosinase family protein [Kordiimonas sp. SCSIO 12603]